MLATMIQQLPREHFHLIYYIVLMASSIQKHSEINMMNPEALAVVLAPVCTGLEQNLKEIPSWVKRHTRTKMMNDMGQYIENNTKWTRIWTLLIEYSDTLLEKWKESILWKEVVTPLGRNTVPCHPSSSSHLKTNKDSPSSSTSPSSSHPSRHSTNLSPFEQTELLLDIVPPYNKPTTTSTTTTSNQRRPSYHSNKSSDELYKVVVMRTRQSTTCKSLKKNNHKRSSLLMDYHQYYSTPPPPPMTHSNSTSTTSRTSSTSSVLHPSLSSNTSCYFTSKQSSITTTKD